MTEPVDEDARDRVIARIQSLPMRREARLIPNRFLRVIALTVSLCVAGAEAAIPTEKDVNDLSLEVQAVVGSFMRESFMLRMQYLYNDGTLGEPDRSGLHEMATEASEKLLTLAESQEKLKAAIEQYDGDDWDRLYGVTGLWRRLLGEVLRTRMSRCEALLYAGLSSGQGESSGRIESALSEIEGLRAAYDIGYLDYLRGQALGSLARIHPEKEPDSKKVFSLLSERSDTQQTTSIRGAISRMWLFGPEEAEQLTRLGDDLLRSGLIDDVELAVSLAIVQRRCAAMEALETVLSANAGARDVVGRLALSKIEHEFRQSKLDPDEVTVIEAELAAVAMIQADPGAYVKVLQWLASWEEFRTGPVIYACAVATVEDEPDEACAYLVEASRLQEDHRSKWLELSSEQIAQEAVRLACDSYSDRRCKAATVVETVEQCRALTGGPLADELEYVYTKALIGTGRTETGLKLLGTMLEKPTDEKSDSLQIEMLKTYCTILIVDRGDAGAEHVAALLGNDEIESDPNLSLIKSKALLQLGRGAESLGCMLPVYRAHICEQADEALGVLAEVISQIEKYELSGPLLRQAGADGLKLGQFCYGCLDGEKKRLAGLYAAEAQVISAAGDEEMLEGVGRFLDEFVGPDSNDVESLRCRARLLMAQGQSLDAASLWRRMASAHKDNGQDSGWLRWRAKYYELLCCAKSSDIEDAELVHTIEVLQSSGDQITSPWDAKLTGLKGQLGAGQ